VAPDGLSRREAGTSARGPLHLGFDRMTGLQIALIIALVALIGVWVFVRKRGGQ